MSLLSLFTRSSPRLALPALLCLLACLAATSAEVATAAPAFYDGNSASGKVAAFTTAEQMVPGDTDQELDVYVRGFDDTLGEYVTREASIGPWGGNDTRPAFYNGLSADGTELVFSTIERLLPADTDQKEDVYLRDLTENTTALVSQGDDSCLAQGCGNGPVEASFATSGLAADGGIVFFTTTESLTGADQDTGLDIYARDLEAGETVLVSAGDSSCEASGCGDGVEGASFRGTDKTGDKAVFTTSESLNSLDEDSEGDIYERDLSAATTALVSVAGTCPPDLPAEQNCEPSFGAISADGSHVFFETNDSLSGLDTDSSQDVYDWSGSGIPALSSIGPDGGNGLPAVLYKGTGADGSAVYFLTAERLDTGADLDAVEDVYRRKGGVTSLVSAGSEGRGNAPVLVSFKAVSAGPAERVFFTTAEQLTAEDTDEAEDVYQRSGGVTTLISVALGGGAFDASFAGASGDGAKVFFGTSEKLVAEDTDSSDDVYMRSPAGVELISTGPIGGNGPFSVEGLNGLAVDGSSAFFVTSERLTVNDDFASERDVYAWTGAGTLLVSVKNASELVLGPPPPVLEATTPASPSPATTPAVVGQAEAGALIKIYKTFNCAGEVVAQGTAAELASPGLTTTAVAPGSTTAFRATAELGGVVSPCSAPISYKQQDPPPPPPPSGEEGTGGTAGPTATGTGPTAARTGGSGSRGHGGVAYATPLPRITFGPAAKTRLRRPSFRFVDSVEQPGTGFLCRVDKQRWAGCSSPFKVRKLKLGRHVFALKAVNAVGTASPSAVTRAFKVVG